ncbi:MAG: acetylornithine/N-succinyldiaminopimelate aminotransferase [Planctomycetota bacterium]|jgi:acetylornithine/N-succinyldiaminopimelate aminotransferase
MAEFPVYSRLDLEIVSGSGMTVTDSSGRTYLDFYGGHAAALLGHSPANLVAALGAQADQLMFQTNLVDLKIRKSAIHALLSLAPDSLTRVFLVNSGAEAVENALRLAFKITKRKKVVALKGSFHGRTAAAGAVTWGAVEKWYEFPNTPFEVEFVEPNDTQALANALDDTVAALIVEPIQGVAGAFDLSADYLREARQLTRDRGVQLIADEVQCGMGRSGYVFAFEAADIVPDILVTAKGLAGGFPAGAVITSAELADQLGVGSMGTTFGGGPLACAMIKVVCDTLSDPNFLERVKSVSRLIRESCRVGPVVDIQGGGLLLGLRTRGLAKDVLKSLRDRGVFAGGAADPHVVRLMPPLIAGAEDVKALAQALMEIGS